MKSYNQFCPVAKAAEVFCARWTPLILRELATGSTRFSQIQRGVPLASPTLLSRRLSELEAEGVVERRRAPGGRGWTYQVRIMRSLRRYLNLSSPKETLDPFVRRT